MFVVTNRKVQPTARGQHKFGKTPNEKGPNELRVFEVTGKNNSTVTLVDDTLTDAEAKKVGYVGAEACTGSCFVAHQLLKRARKNKKNVLFFVHGYNNDIGDVLRRASKLESNYDVEVVAFSWPANGGGLRGAASYKSDKRDAKASVGALDRTLAKMSVYLEGFLEETRRKLYAKALKKYPNCPEKRDALLTELTEKDCPVKISMLAHSMGNYLYKHLLFSTASEGNTLLFDNVILAAADANNRKHAAWIDRIRCRRRVYVTLNENDRALRLSRMKTGDEQLARLGHYPFQLDSHQGVYVDFSSASWVKDSHAYFEGPPVEKNDDVYEFFRLAVNGAVAEDGLKYRDDRNLYALK